MKTFKTLLIVVLMTFFASSCSKEFEGELTCKELKELCKTEDVKIIIVNVNGNWQEYSAFKFEGHFLHLSSAEGWEAYQPWTSAYNLDKLEHYVLGQSKYLGADVKSLKLYFCN